MTPGLSCLPVSLYPEFSAGKMTIADWGDIACNIGLDAIDLSVLMTRRLDSDALRATGDILRKMGMPVDTVATYTDFTHPDTAAREGEFERFKTDVMAAGALGAAYLRITAGQAHPQTAGKQGLCLAEKYLRRAADFAAGKNIGLLFENHSKPGVWNYYDFAGPPDVYFALTERLDGMRIDLLFDTANALVYRQAPETMLEKIYGRVKRIHLNDIKQPGILEPTLLGVGVVNFEKIFDYLKAKDYQGMMSIEEASFTGIAGLKKAAAYVKHLLRTKGMYDG